MDALGHAIAQVDELFARLLVTNTDQHSGDSPAKPAGSVHQAELAPPVSTPWKTFASKAVPDAQTEASSSTAAPATATPAAAAATSSGTGPAAPADGAPALEFVQKKKEKKKKPAAAPPPAPETPEDIFSKANLQVARVLAVEALENSDKLYKTKVEVAGGETRQIVAGLSKHIVQDDMLNSLVVVITNLKAAKLAGHVSEGMILAGVATNEAHPDGKHVTPVRPNPASEVGARVFIAGTTPGETPKVLKSAPWAAIKEQLRVVDGTGRFNGAHLVTEAGPVTVAGLPDDAVIS